MCKVHWTPRASCNTSTFQFLATGTLYMKFRGRWSCARVVATHRSRQDPAHSLRSRYRPRGPPQAGNRTNKYLAALRRAAQPRMRAAGATCPWTPCLTRVMYESDSRSTRAQRQSPGLAVGARAAVDPLLHANPPPREEGVRPRGTQD